MSSKSIKFSFPKTDRFVAPKKQYDDVIYNIPDTKSQRYAALGFGKKTSFTDNTPKTPGPGTYANPSLFRSKSETNFGITMGYGRQLVKANDYIPKPDNDIGPQYNLPNTLTQISFSFKQRPQEIIKNNVPGPGQYPVYSTLSATGKYALSKLENSKCSVFNPPNSQRFIKNNQKETPGPGQYDPKISQQTGKFVISNMKSIQPISFPKKERVIYEINNHNPGPGTYTIQ